MNGLAQGIRARRSLVVMPDYLVDRLEWQSSRDVSVSLPIHAPAETSDLQFTPDTLHGGPSLDDGFAFVRAAERASVDGGEVVQLRLAGARGIRGWVSPSHDAQWWRAIAPGPPGSSERMFSLVRMAGREGSITTVWSWDGAVTSVEMPKGSIVVQHGDAEHHEHARRDGGWTVTLHNGTARSSIDLGGQRPTAPPPAASPRTQILAEQITPLHIRAGRAPLVFELAERAYRRSEESWQEAGSPRAVVTLTATQHDLVIGVAVQKPEVILRAPGAVDPALDNEHPDIHSDGVQLYLAVPGWDRPEAWLAVPEEPAPRVRTRAVDGARAEVALTAGWTREREGYTMRFEIPLDMIGAGRTLPLALDLIVNEMAPGRIRRRGQLVLSGGGGWTYLQGDRQSPAWFLPIVIERG